MNNTLQHRLWIFSMVAAPVLISIAQFFWDNGLLTITAGWIQVLSFTFWIVAFQGMFSFLKIELPKYAVVGFLIAVYACIGGAGFGYDGIYTNAFGYTTQAEIDGLIAKIGAGIIPVLFLPGALFPLSLAVLGIQLIRTKKIAPWIGIILFVAAIGFPLSRIPRIDVLAHFDNILLIVSHVLVAIKIKPQ